MKTDYKQQAQEFLDKTGTTMAIEFSYCGPYFDEDKDKRNVYSVTLRRKDRGYVFKFGDSIHNTKNGVKPTAYDVLTCLTKDDPGTFKDFCGDFGYDEDSRKAEKVYFAAQAEWANVQRLFSDVLDELREIQ